MTTQILAERPGDAAHIEPLLDLTFGLGRKQKTVYALRDGLAPAPGLCFSAVAPNDGLLGSLRFWPIDIGGNTAAILLGPLTVEPALQGAGIGRALVAHGLAEARRLGERICVVVGAPSFYRPFGFAKAGPAGLVLPGPVEPERFQVLELVSGALERVGGPIRRAERDVAGGSRRLTA